MKLIIYCMFLFFLTASGLSIKEKLDELRGQYPELDRLANALDFSPASKQTKQTKQELPLDKGVDMKHYLDTIFRFWDFDGTDMGKIINSGQLPDMEALQEQFSLYTLLERLEDEEVQDELRDTFEYFAKQKALGTGYSDRNPTVYDDNGQVGGYEGCKRDYDSLAEPFTNGLINLGWDAIIGDLLPKPYLENRTLTIWGFLMFDALTKVPEGLTDGKLHWLGSYELCNRIEVDYNYTEAARDPPWPLPPVDAVFERREFNAQYCRVQFNPVNPLLGNGTDILTLRLGICVPDTCSPDHITTYLTDGGLTGDGNMVLAAVLSLLGLKIEHVYCGQVTDYDSDPRIKTCVAIIIICFCLLVLASLYDGLWRPYRMKAYVDTLPKKQHLARSISQMSEVSTPPVIGPGGSDMNGPKPPIMRQTSYHEVDKDEYRRYSTSDISNANNNNNKPALTSQVSTSSVSPLVEEINDAQIQQDKPTVMDRLEVAFVGFSAYSNLGRVFSIHDHNPELELPALNGVRFLSWAYALYGHTWLFGPIYNECWTTSNLVRAVRELPRKWSFQPVINFHFSADAMFVISGCLVAYWWLKKYNQLRKLSVGFIVKYYLFRYWTLMPALMLTLMVYTTSYRYLGSGPLFPVDVGDAEKCKTNWWTDLLLMHNLINVNKMCLTWTWYVGILWQLHIVTSLILIPLVLKPVIGYIMLGVFYVAHVGATAGITADIVDQEGFGDSAKSYARDYFFTPWCRAGPYIVGLVLGIILYKCKRKAKLNIFLVLLGWAVAMVCICSVEYATYGILKEGGERWDKGTRVMYDTFSRTSYGVGVAWIIFACVTGNGGVINDILSWKVFIPLSRMIYPSYLMHAMMIFTFVYGQYSLLYVNESNVMYWFFGNLWIVHVVGLFFVGLFFYYPISLGVIRAITVRTKLECVKAGCHPEIPEAIDTPYNGGISTNPTYGVTSINSVSKTVHDNYEDLRQRHVAPSKDYEELNKKTTEL